MRIMAISDFHGNLEGFDPSDAAAGVLPKRSVFRFGNCFRNLGCLLKRRAVSGSCRKV
jgi:hypothetical protein